MPAELSPPAVQTPTWLRHPHEDWQADSLDRAALYGAAQQLRAHPEFPAAMHAFASNILDTYRSHWAVNHLMKEQGRFAFLAFVMYLHHTRNPQDPASGVTYSRVRDLFAGSGLASPTRIKAMMALGRLGGQLRALPGADKRAKIVAPTEKLTQPASLWLKGFLDALVLIKPLPLPTEELIARPHLLGAVLTYNVYALKRSHFMLHESFPEIRAFMEREHGYLLLMHMVRSMQVPAANGDVPTRAPSGEFARRYSVARGTVRNVLAMGEQRAWLQVQSRGAHDVLLSSAFVRRVQDWIALELEWMGENVKAAIRAG